MYLHYSYYLTGCKEGKQPLFETKTDMVVDGLWRLPMACVNCQMIMIDGILSACYDYYMSDARYHYMENANADQKNLAAVYIIYHSYTRLISGDWCVYRTEWRFILPFFGYSRG